MSLFRDEHVQILREGGVGIIPTDTLYGIVASALDQSAVERVYAIRKRDLGKSCILLIADIEDLRRFSIQLSEKEQIWLEALWPKQVSVILRCHSHEYKYLSRETESLAFRIPENESLQAFLRLTGPLIAPSANIQGRKPATTVDEAKAYFEGQVDFFIDGGTQECRPSTVVQLKEDVVTLIRPGAVDLHDQRRE